MSDLPIMADKSELAEIFQDTIWHFINPQTPDYNVPKPLYFNQEILDANATKIEPRFDSMTVFVENKDSFDMAKELLDAKETDSDHILVLNLASAKRPGGGVVNGARAQEECLFRRSNYFAHLPDQLYRLENDALIISRNVIVIKDSYYELYADYDVPPFTTNCIAASALVNPKVVEGHNKQDTYKFERDYKKMEQKIYNIFHTAYINGYDTLVLGAIGCGAFHNPVHDVAKIYRDTIEKFDKCFKTVGFAILSRGKNTNCEIFKTHIELSYNGNKK